MMNLYLSGYDVLQYYTINLAKNTSSCVKMPIIEKYYRAPRDYFLFGEGVNSAVESAWIIKMGRFRSFSTQCCNSCRSYN